MKNTTNNSPEFSDKFVCKKCDYMCCKKGDFNKHLQSKKHNTTNTTKIQPILTYTCLCGKVYNHRASLYNHKKGCSYEDNTPCEDIPNTTDTTTNPLIIENMFAMFTQMMTQNHEFMANVICKVQGITNNHNINTTTNNHFNINLFLNDQCKDAMNLTDFVKNIHCQIQDLEYTGKDG